MTDHQSELHIFIDWECYYTKSEFELELTESSTLKMIEMIQFILKKNNLNHHFPKYYPSQKDIILKI